MIKAEVTAHFYGLDMTIIGTIKNHTSMSTRVFNVEKILVDGIDVKSETKDFIIESIEDELSRFIDDYTWREIN